MSLLVLITGATSGLGLAASRRLAKAGATLILVARTVERLYAVREELLELGAQNVEVISADVSKLEQVKGCFEEVKKKFGYLDVIFANAGATGIRAPVWDITVEEWRELMDSNLRGCFHTCKYGVPLLKASKRGAGSLIITSSISGTSVFSQTGVSAYAATKAGQLAMGRMLALELARYKIRVNIICPGHTESNIHSKTRRRNSEEASVGKSLPNGNVPLTGGKMLPSEAIGDLVYFLSTDDSAYISGTPIWIDGAESLLL